VLGRRPRNRLSWWTNTTLAFTPVDEQDSGFTPVGGAAQREASWPGGNASAESDQHLTALF
jgi:hypothetical protein